MSGSVAHDAWTHDALGVNPATFMAAALPGAPAGHPTAMQPGCKIVHGKVPGPANHVMCATHHHILDTKAHTIIAASLAEYLKQHPVHAGGHPAHGHAPVAQPANTPAANPAPPAAAAAPAPAAAGAAAAPAPDEAAITRGCGAAYTFAKETLTHRGVILGNEISQWETESTKMVAGMNSHSGDIGDMILKVVDVILTVAVPEAGILATVAKGAGAMMKGAQAANSADASDAAGQEKEAKLAISDTASKAREAIRQIMTQADPALKSELAKLRDPDSLVMLARGSPDDLDALCKRIGVPNDKQELNGACSKLRSGMRHEMRSWLKQSARKKQEGELDGVAKFTGMSKEAKAQAMVDWEVQWGKDYADHQESALLDADVDRARDRH